MNISTFFFKTFFNLTTFKKTNSCNNVFTKHDLSSFTKYDASSFTGEIELASKCLYPNTSSKQSFIPCIFIGDILFLFVILLHLIKIIAAFNVDYLSL